MTAQWSKWKFALLIIAVAVLGLGMTYFGPHRTLDTHLYYSGDQARAFLAEFSPLETRVYIINECFDLVFLSLYTALFYFGFKKAFPKSRYAFIALIPGALDLIETVLILYALNFGAAQTYFDWLGTVTFLKWSLGATLLLILAARLIRQARILARG